LSVTPFYFQETHPELLFKECSHYCELISQPSQAPRIVEIAIQTALARQGVSVIVVPGDVALREAVNQELRIRSYAHARSSVRPNEATLDEIAGILNDAKSSTSLAGAGCQFAHDELVEVAGR